MSFCAPPRPYPADRSATVAGDATATMRLAATPPYIASPNGSCDYLATGAATNGGYGLYRWSMGPEPAGPDAHFHRAVSESFFILSGTIRLYDGRRWVDGEPGDFLHVPEGGLHGFRNESGQPASLLILFSPGAPPRGLLQRTRRARPLRSSADG